MKYFLSLSFIIFSLFLSFTSCQRFCNGVYCDANCENCYPCKQEINCMIASGCFCASKNIPGSLPRSQTPQFVFLTFDDAINTEWFTGPLKSLDFILKNSSILDSRGCSPKTSIYFMGDTSDYNMANYLAGKGSVGYHTKTHTTSLISPPSVWEDELGGLKSELNQLAKIPKVKGSRAPFLQTNDAYFEELQKIGAIYDTSFVYGWAQNNIGQSENFWPSTMDYGVPDPLMCKYFGNCPTKSYPGFWEFPIISFKDSSFLMDYDVSNYDVVMSQMKQNFRNSYNFNKVPRGFYIHWRYLTNNGDFDFLHTQRVKFLVEFFGWLSATFPDIIFTTEDKVINWIKNPQPISIVKTMSDFQCSNSYPTTPLNSCPYGVKTCSYNAISLKVCGRKCPQPFPALGAPFSYDQVNRKEPHWPGVISVYVEDEWPSGFCASISVEHSSSSIAIGWILSEINLASAGTVTAFWGYVQHSMNLDSLSGIYRQIGFDAYIPSNVETIIGGWCMQTAKIGAYYNGWIEKNVRFGIDLYAKNLNCPLEGCMIFCGDGKCDDSKGETAVNCAFDCKEIKNPARILSERNL